MPPLCQVYNCRIISSKKRYSIRRGNYSGSSGTRQRRVADRFARRLGRNELKKLRRALAIDRPRKLEKQTLLVRYSQNPILDKLINNRNKKWRAPLRRIVKQQLESVRLKNFCFLTNPDETLAAIRQIGELELSESKAYLHFDDHFCLDAGAYSSIGGEASGRAVLEHEHQQAVVVDDPAADQLAV